MKLSFFYRNKHCFSFFVHKKLIQAISVCNWLWRYSLHACCLICLENVRLSVSCCLAICLWSGLSHPSLCLIWELVGLPYTTEEWNIGIPFSIRLSSMNCLLTHALYWLQRLILAVIFGIMDTSCMKSLELALSLAKEPLMFLPQHLGLTYRVTLSSRDVSVQMILNPELRNICLMFAHGFSISGWSCCTLVCKSLLLMFLSLYFDFNTFCV